MTDEAATKDELKSLHKLIKKVTGDIETFSYNTSISAFMICVNELSSLKCNKKEVLNQLIIVLTPFAPHVCEELWETLGNTDSVCDAHCQVGGRQVSSESHRRAEEDCERGSEINQ